MLRNVGSWVGSAARVAILTLTPRTKTPCFLYTIAFLQSESRYCYTMPSAGSRAAGRTVRFALPHWWVTSSFPPLILLDVHILVFPHRKTNNLIGPCPMSPLCSVTKPHPHSFLKIGGHSWSWLLCCPLAILFVHIVVLTKSPPRHLRINFCCSSLWVSRSGERNNFELSILLLPRVSCTANRMILRPSRRVVGIVSRGA
jgi:hypothetical protein